MKYNFVVIKDGNLITALSENIGGVSLPAFKAILKSGELKLNGKKQLKNCEVKKGDEVSIFIAEKYRTNADLSVIFADQNIVIVDKPPLLDVENNLLQLVRQSYPTAEPVHRLDRNTSGLVVFSLNPAAELSLKNGFKTRLVDKFYLAEVQGEFADFGEKTAYLKKDAEKSQVWIADSPKSEYKKIVTEFLPFKPDKVASAAENKLKSGDEKTGSTHIEVRLITGRTHQIRAHLAHLGHPVLGDKKYGSLEGAGRVKKGYALKSYKIVFGRLEAPLEYLNGKVFALKKDKFID